MIAEATQVIGTPGFMAPEVATASHRRHLSYCCGAADIWSVGILLRQLITKNPPFAHKNDSQIFDMWNAGTWQQTCAELMRPIEGRNQRRGSEELVNLVRCCLNNDASARPEAQDVLTSLMAIKENLAHAPQGDCNGKKSDEVVPAPHASGKTGYNTRNQTRKH